MVSHTIHTETHSTRVSWIRASVRSQDGEEILLVKVRIDPSIHCHTVPLRAVPTPPASDWLTDFTPHQLICACHLCTVRGSVAWCLCHYRQKRTKMTHKQHTPLIWLVKRNLEYLVFLLIAKHFQNNTPLYLSFLRLLISTISLPVNARTRLQLLGNQLQGQVCNFSVSISIKLTSAS